MTDRRTTMTDRPITRRRALAMSAGAFVGMAGCLGGPETDGAARDADGGDGFALDIDDSVSVDIDLAAYDTTEQDGVDVPLAPIEDTYDWYRSGGARFVDARGGGQYESERIEGAVLSPAPDGDGEEPDPVDDWDTDDVIVTYCDCPHHLAAARAADLVQNGHENVAVIDEGFVPWVENGYPTAGEKTGEAGSVWTVAGVTDPSFAGDLAWGVHEATDQQEAVPIADDGTFEMTIRFSGLTDDTELVVETPASRTERPIGELAAETIYLD